MKKILANKAFLLYTFVVVLLFFTNLYMYKHSYKGFLYTDACNYNEFYCINDNYRIQGFQSLQQDSLLIQISPESIYQDWTIKYSNKQDTLRRKKNPVVKLLKGINNYEITSLSNSLLKPVLIQIEYLPENNPQSIVAVFCSLPMIGHDLYPLSKWVTLSEKISEDEIIEAKKILQNEVKLKDSDNSLIKIQKLGSFLIGKLRLAEAGTQPKKTLALTPLSKYKEAIFHNSLIACGDYCAIYHFFANCAGIPTRKIGIGGKINDVDISGHLVDESYIKEQQKWAFVDLMSKKLFVLNDSSEVLNTIDLLNINTCKVYGNTRALIVNKDNKIDTVAYLKVNQSEKEYFEPAGLYYCIKEDIYDCPNSIECLKEYLSSTSHYGVYYANTLKIDNERHYFKLFMFYTFICFAVVWLVIFIFVISFYRHTD